AGARPRCGWASASPSESAVAGRARSASASRAAQPRKVESTPPEKATTTLPRSRRISRSRARFAWSSGARAVRPASVLKLHHLPEGLVPVLDLAVAEAQEPVEREVLHGERRHHAPVHD